MDYIAEFSSERIGRLSIETFARVLAITKPKKFLETESYD